MTNGYLLYNPLAGNFDISEELPVLEVVLDAELKPQDITKIGDYRAFLETLGKDDILVVAGGDGTLNRFVNDTDGIDFSGEILYYPVGTGNDFAHDLGKSRDDNPFPIAAYLKNLPTVEVRGRKYRFLNGVGYGLDGYCCEVGDELRKIPGKKVNYTAIAIKGLLVDYIPVDAAVTVDGVRHTFSKVWIAPTMFGRYYGGGMMPTPAQSRTDPEGELSVMVFHSSGKLKTLAVFPGIFSGKHVRHTGCVTVLTGHEITVEYSSPRPLQVDGETILNVRAYTARSNKGKSL